MEQASLNQPVTILKNVGEKRASALAKIGITTIGDLVTHFPRAYQNRGEILTVEEVKIRLRRRLTEQAAMGEAEGKASLYSEPCALLLTVAAEPTVKTVRRGMTLVKFRAFDETGTCDLTYFNMAYMKDVVHTGAVFRFFGRFSLLGSRLRGANPIFEAVTEGAFLPDIVPVYPLCAGVNQKLMAQLTADALRYGHSALAEFLPPRILKAMGLPAYSYTIHNLHRPESMAALEAVQRRRVFEELYFLFTALAASGNKKKQESRLPMADRSLDKFRGALPFTLTEAQERCIAEITSDMAGEFVMNRMLTGDVGSGKTVVAAVALYLAVKNGYRGVLMVPTEILAAQHYKDLSALFEPLGIRCALLTGSTGKRERDALRASLSDIAMDGCGTDIVIGTHALIAGAVEIPRLGVAVIDEQHRFGVKERAALLEKCAGIHSLVMSATPIPRTLTLALYGDLDVSRIDRLPAGRQKIDTFVVDEGYRERLNGFIRKQVDEGHQVYIVCPTVEEKKKSPGAGDTEDAEEMANVTLSSLLYAGEEELPPLKAAETYAATLAEQLPDLRIAFVHGKLKNAQKDLVMGAFSAGEVDVLVSTTVIEVGVNVPNATLMIVENAERFGLSQLHQLRGRVGRGSAKSYFILVSDARGETARQRLAAIKSTTDGFQIAEYDLEQRGPGDFLGSDSIKQHGQMRLSLAAGCRDKNLIERAVALAKETVADDPTLSKAENAGLAARVSALLRQSENIVN